MSRDPKYQRLLNSPRWAETKRIVWQRADGRCEVCREEGIAAGVLPDGYVRPGKDCHHIVPVETARTLAEMERLCYDPNNIKLVCVEHHIAIHRQMGKGTKANRQERAAERQARWRDHVIALANGANRGEAPPTPTCGEVEDPGVVI